MPRPHRDRPASILCEICGAEEPVAERGRVPVYCGACAGMVDDQRRATASVERRVRELSEVGDAARVVRVREWLRSETLARVYTMHQDEKYAKDVARARRGTSGRKR